MLNELKPWHLLILAGVFVVLFGSKKLPDAARSLGKSLRIFKSEVKALREDDDEPKAIEAPNPAASASASAPAAAAQPPVAVAPTESAERG